MPIFWLLVWLGCCCVTLCYLRWDCFGDTSTFSIVYYEKPEKTADNLRRHYWFPREMMSEKRAQKFHTRHYPDLGSSSDWMKQIYNQ